MTKIYQARCSQCDFVSEQFSTAQGALYVEGPAPKSPPHGSHATGGAAHLVKRTDPRLVELPLEDAARALQFVRSKRGEWNLDPSRISASGSSAGACSALWLALDDDLADATSTDPVARESTRLACVAVARAQTSLDPQQMQEWIPNNRYGAHAFGFETYQDFAAAREKILPWIREYSPYELATHDDPPVGL